MKLVSHRLLFILSCISLCLLAQAQSSSPPQQPPAAIQPPASQPSSEQQPPMQPDNAPAGQQQPRASAPQGSNVASTLQVYASPKANQTPDKQAQDESQCYQWAQGQSAPQEQQQQQAQQAQATDNIKRAYSACMESRNYTIK